MKHVHPKEFSSLAMMPSLTCPHLVLPKKDRTAGIHLSSANKIPIGVFPGPLTLPSFHPCILNPNPFLPVYVPFLSNSPWPPVASPTSFQSFLISSFQAKHSLKRCSLVCRPFVHRQQVSELTHPNFSFRKGAVIACPDASWKKSDANLLGAFWRALGILGCPLLSSLR